MLSFELSPRCGRRRDTRARTPSRALVCAFAPGADALLAQTLSLSLELRVVRRGPALELPPRLLLVRGNRARIGAGSIDLSPALVPDERPAAPEAGALG